MNDNELLNFDLVRDEYGNYYEVTIVKSTMGKLQSVTILNALYKIADNRMMIEDEYEKNYKNKHISDFLMDILKSRIEYQKRDIKTIQELVEAGVEVEITDYTKLK